MAVDAGFNKEARMSSPSLKSNSVIALRPLVACLSMSVGLTAATDVPHGTPGSSPQLATRAQRRSEGGANIPVSNCNDQGAGSLRDAVTNVAVSGDIVDMSGLNCSTITLISGAITVAEDDLEIVGPGTDMNAMTILAGHSSQIFVHSGSGLLTLEYMTVTSGGIYTSGSDARGGCVYSSGSVSLRGVGVKYCVAQAQGHGYVRGGGVYARGSIAAVSSTIAGNSALGDQNDGSGGGVFAVGALFTNYSWFHGNEASMATRNDHVSAGGALFVGGDATILNSTLSSNTAEVVGGASVFGSFAKSNLEITNTTICDNYSSDARFGSGLAVSAPVVISNSTITGNVSRSADHATTGAGLYVGSAATVQLNSTIVSGNSSYDGATSIPDDIGYSRPGGALVGGSSNLVGHSTLPLSLDTIRTTEPGLGALTIGNGGPTPTKMPSPGSLAINHGNNASGSAFDQRGEGFPRVVGARADVGAVESDAIFADGFD